MISTPTTRPVAIAVRNTAVSSAASRPPGLPVVDRRHHGVVEDVGVDMDPVALWTVGTHEVRDRILRGLFVASRADRRQVESEQLRGQRLATVPGALVAVAEAECDGILDRIRAPLQPGSRAGP